MDSDFGYDAIIRNHKRKSCFEYNKPFWGQQFFLFWGDKSGISKININFVLQKEIRLDDSKHFFDYCRFLQAGVDIVLGPQNLVQAFDAVMAAIENGTITENRINQSVRRILKLKAK